MAEPRTSTTGPHWNGPRIDVPEWGIRGGFVLFALGVTWTIFADDLAALFAAGPVAAPVVSASPFPPPPQSGRDDPPGLGPPGDKGRSP